MKTNLQPVLKWVGGKRQIIQQIMEQIPDDYGRYFEPFLGGGSVFLSIRPKSAVINDYNDELMNLYKIIKINPNGLVRVLSSLKNEKTEFYRIRNLDRDINFHKSNTDEFRAARTVFLNKTCFNGLYRVNANGEFNVPFGNYKNPKIFDSESIFRLSDYLNKYNIKILNTDYFDSLKFIRKNDFVYIDPPYDPVSASSSFTSYTEKGFTKEDQIKLKKTCDILNSKGVKFLLSNSATDFILDLYKDYNVTLIDVRRNIAASNMSRKVVKEVLVRNYEK
jgi:DNA adenine methylase